MTRGGGQVATLSRGSAATALAVAVILSACSPAPPRYDRIMRAGEKVKMRNGLRFTVPPGGLATSTPDPANTIVEQIQVQSRSSQWSVQFSSFPTPTAAQAASSAESSQVTVIVEPEGRVLIQTRLKGVLPAVVGMRPGKLPDRGLALARRLWAELHVEGVSLPSVFVKE
jgi:hypothetical protein